MKDKQCEGNCISNYGEHKGDVMEVIVSGQGFIATKFYYCQNAIDEDIKRGFQVHKLSNENKKDISWLLFFRKFKSDITNEEVDYILWNETCYPFDDVIAKGQVEEYFASLNNKY